MKTTSIEKPIEWLELDEASLKGGIMLTGSIGSGKSVAAMIPWFEQALTNFDPRPAVLLMDAKGMLTKDAIKLVKKHNLENNLLHLRFGGNLKMNPLYRKQILKSGSYAEVAYMIRAATLNFAGKESGESKFWGIKGSDLLRNTTVYCGAKYGDYFTLIEFYGALLACEQSDFGVELRAFQESGKFDEEETFNINSAINYFERDYSKLDSKMKSSIFATATTFLTQLLEYQTAKIFCPKKEDVTFWSFDEVLKNGNIFVFDIDNYGISKALGTLIKLLYQTAVLNRYRVNDVLIEKKPLAFSFIDEYPDVATFGGSDAIGDDTYQAKCRAAGGVNIYAMQSHSSLESALGDKKACDTLLQNFRTHIAGHSLDHKTISFFSSVAGEEEVEKESENYSETGSHPTGSFFRAELQTDNPTVSKSLQKSFEKRNILTGDKFAKLRTFEAIGIVFTSGIDTEVHKIALKPAFLANKRTPHEEVLKPRTKKRKSFLGFALTSLIFALGTKAVASPTVCSIVNSVSFNECLNLTATTTVCGYPPRPCMFYSYYVPQSYHEVREDSGTSFFSDLPGVAAQLKRAPKTPLSMGGIDEMDSYHFHANSIGVPMTKFVFNMLPCDGARTDKMCLDAASFDLGTNWVSGLGDLKQPALLAWKLSPKACLIKGAASSFTGEMGSGMRAGAPSCSFPLKLPLYPPSEEPVCTGWGFHLPRTGAIEATSRVNASLLVAASIKSIASEVFNSAPSSPDEKWQMLYPQTSNTCFRKGQNLGILETTKNTTEIGRLNLSKTKNYLYSTWKRVSCYAEITEPAKVAAVLAAIKGICGGME